MKRVIIIAVIIIFVLLLAMYYYGSSSSGSTGAAGSSSSGSSGSTGSTGSSSSSSNPFVGSYGAGTNILDTGNGGVSVVTSDGRSSPGTVTGNNINVQFLNDPGCCTGTINNGVITWSNGSSWTKTN